MKFESRFNVNKDMYKEYVYKVLYRNYFIKNAVIFLLAFLLLIFNRNDEIMITLTSVALFICLFGGIFLPRLTLKNLLKLTYELHGGSHPDTVVTFEDDITLIEGKQRISFEYSQVKKYYRLRNCSVLMISSQNGIMFVEDALKEKEFEKFIMEKCPQIEKIIQR